ncbi:hypothetical protein [Kosakonia radicincitans]|uniref:hypothetical protein n=1 Tax=Kosakonia radicincitans TaxID=283686 RepID=UPI0005C315F2|nr:hypothetical protein [Kosakonia radicincitans]KIS41570.1 hypothetical protein LG58_921 [Kosakonia radicincitans YD4]
MLCIDESEFPLVWLIQVDQMENRSSQSEAYDNSFIQLEKILGKKIPFVIISATEFEDEEQHEHSKEEKMKLALWLKKNKANVKKYIIAQIQIVPENKQSLILKGFAKAFSKFWGYPMLIVSDKENAIVKANNLLNNIKQQD